ncbi:hypothetical protein MRX96_016387 [Rhipicephalus microplus]
MGGGGSPGARGTGLPATMGGMPGTRMMAPVGNGLEPRGRTDGKLGMKIDGPACIAFTAARSFQGDHEIRTLALSLDAWELGIEDRPCSVGARRTAFVVAETSWSDPRNRLPYCLVARRTVGVLITTMSEKKPDTDKGSRTPDKPKSKEGGQQQSKKPEKSPEKETNKKEQKPDQKGRPEGCPENRPKGFPKGVR